MDREKAAMKKLDISITQLGMREERVKEEFKVLQSQKEEFKKLIAQIEDNHKEIVRSMSEEGF